VLLGGKANPMQGRVTKVTQGANVMVFQNKTKNAYEAMVRRRLEQEGKNPDSFELGVRSWGSRIPNTPIIEHEKDGDVKYYLEVIFLKPGATEYFLDGRRIKKEDIQGLKDVEVDETSQGGLDKKVVIRTISVDNITEVRIDGRAYN